MGQWQSGYVTANGVKIHYTRTGGDKPAVVLNHGSGDSGLCWTRVAMALEAEYDVVLPDARDHGLTEAPEGGDDQARAGDLAALIDALKLERPVVGGHSMGGSTTLCFAATYDMLSAAILEDGGIQLPGEVPLRWPAARDVLEDKQMSREQLVAHARLIYPTWSEEELAPWADARLQVSARHLNTPPTRLDFRELLPKVKAPLLLITADPELGAIVTPEAAAQAKRLLPSMTVVRLSQAGHNIHREQFTAFITAASAFLKLHAGLATRTASG